MNTHRENVLRKYGLPTNTSLSLASLSKLSNIPYKYLLEIYKRGIGAWKTNISSVRIKDTFEKNPDIIKYPRETRLTKENWGYARVYSFLDKGKTYYTADADIAKKI